MKFKNYIETESGIKDTSTSPGTAGQLLSSTVAGTSWIDQNTISSGTSEVVDIQVKNISSADGGINLSKGDPVYIYGSVGASPRLYIDLADADSTATNNLGDGKMPCVALLDQDLTPNQEGTATVVGKLRNLITSPIDGSTPNENDTVYVKSGGGLTLTKPTGSTNLIQNVGQVGRVSTSADGNIVVAALLRSNDVPNLTTGKIWVGSAANTTESTVVHLDETNERMGIRTTSPGATLEVQGRTSNTEAALKVTDSGDRFFEVVPDNNTTFKLGDIDALGDELVIVGSYGDLKFNASGSTTMTLDNNNRVGIGTTSPQEKLHIYSTEAGAVRAEIESTQAADAIIKYTNSNRSYATFLTQSGQFSIYDYNAASHRFYMLTNGNIGIGTTNPGSKLTVNGSTRMGGNVEVSELLSGDKVLTLTANTGGFAIGDIDGLGDQAFISGDGSNIEISINQSTSLYCDSNNRVGIGTTSPTALLTLESSSFSPYPGIDIKSTNTYPGGEIRFLDSSGSEVSTIEAYNNPGISYLRLNHNVGSLSSTLTLDDGFLHLSTAGSERMRINSLGNVGIGTTSPSSQVGSTKVLDISSNGNGEIILDHTDAGSSSDLGLYSWNRNNDHLAHIKASCDGATDSAFISLHTQATGGSFSNPSSNERMRITSDGNVGIGTTSPNSKLHVAGTVSLSTPLANFDGNVGSGVYGAVSVRVDNINYGTAMKFYRSLSADNNAIGFQNGASTVGSISIGASSTSYNTTSDYRLKENLTAITDGIDRLKQLKPRRFNFIGNADVVDGFIAHEAKEVIPESVTGEKDEVLPNGDPVYQGIDQAKIVPLLTAALQEAVTKIEQLETRIQTLENK